MSIKLKVLGLGLLAVMATSAFAVMNASAVTGGHFTHDDPGHHVTIEGTENPGTSHVLHLVKEGGSAAEKIGCDKESYLGTVTATTVQSIKIVPEWEKCYTTGDSNKTDIPIHENGCYFEFTSGKTGQTHHTAHFICPGEPLVITHPNCTITIPTQTTQGVTYDTITLNEKHAITLNVTTKGITAHYHGGICIFLGTTQKSEMTGGVTVEGFNTLGKPVNLTSTTG